MVHLLEGMAHMEGFNVAGDRPQRNNNPLDLTWGSEAKRFGATQGDHSAPGGLDGFGGMAVFPTALKGWQAASSWLAIPAVFDKNGNLERGYRGATLRKVIYRFAPPNENNSEAYLNYVCEQTGYTAATVLTSEMLGVPASVQQ